MSYLLTGLAGLEASKVPPFRVLLGRLGFEVGIAGVPAELCFPGFDLCHMALDELIVVRDEGLDRGFDVLASSKVYPAVWSVL
jgi:hypothetical protein